MMNNNVYSRFDLFGKPFNWTKCYEISPKISMTLLLLVEAAALLNKTEPYHN